jgi:peptidoglycan hydrolase-like protein with peptidoglycan-binding domain
MQPRILWTTFALGLSASGLAYAADDRPSDPGHAREASPSEATSVSLSRQQTMQMQRALKSRNIYQGQVDGVWGPKTESALRNFQTQSGLEATGELNDATARALGVDMSGSSAAGATMSGERQTVSGSDRGAEVSPPAAGTTTPQTPAQLEDGKANLQLSSLSQEQAREMQQRLQLLGYYRGPVDGKIGEGTRTALASYFQRQAELARQGVISNSAISLFGTEVGDVQPVGGRDPR